MSRENVLKYGASSGSIYRYPDGSFSGVVCLARRGESTAPVQRESWYSNLDAQERDAENRRRSGRRASETMRRAVRSGNLCRLLTFTNGGSGDGWTDLRQALRDVLTWYREDGQTLLGQTGFVVVAERGSARGRVHVHAAIRAGYRIDYSAIIRSWSAFLEARGYHSANATHRFHAGDDTGKHSQGFKSARQCARYMSKYLSKGFESDEYHKHSKHYRTVGCDPIPPQTVSGFKLGEVPQMLRDTFHGQAVEFHEFWDTIDPDKPRFAGFWFEVEPPPL